MTFRDQVVVVTGGGGGIGRAMVLDLLGCGAQVAALDIRQDGLEEITNLAAAGGRLSTHAVDVSDRAGVQGVAEQVLARHGSIDGVIHNAGIIQPFARFVDLDYEAIDKVVAVNMYGTVHVAKAFLPHLMTRPEARFAVVSSAASFLPLTGQGIYGATKAAVKLFTEGLRAELSETGVSVSVVIPGSVATDIASNSGVDMGSRFESDSRRSSATTAEAAARIALDGIEARRMHVLVGRDAGLLNFASRIAPKLTTRLVAKRLNQLLP
ncbi:hypothetical protein BH708_03950 [Brachybacterium sp. P6-10-X1]|uniref:SDR family NAD(P)-dependent oxidoreductase n=1 Tax=Brachybacterium sp. P6-10-X1 TaxID=1903186 RepID=UPI0009719141|nr:SDR family oxidoreductase [Brachybacterium sp. P6-10-X1]APX32022.1 hypothetical protein BH708_03950 [Brachybacterium sp. P6-10-X1]